jgi:two-component system, chemotaxis family, response regulator Rcp1
MKRYIAQKIETRPVDILLVEDNPGDVRLTKEALKDAKVLNEIYVAKDGVEAMQFVHREGSFANAPMPDLILLDLNLPRKDGREVLAEIKKDPKLQHIPVVVLTTSKADEDIIKTYNLHANAYITKPVDLNRFVEIMHALEQFWFTIVKLPPKE